jgi:protein O-mannosyl-transferase
MRRELGLSALLVVVTLAVYCRVCRFGFLIFDDPACVTENSHVLAGLSPSGLRWAFTTFFFANWMPLTWLSLMLDATCFGTWPGGYHITNLLLHTASVLVVFATFTRATGDRLRSAFVAVLFAVHPLNVESVAWVAERKGALSMVFGLLSLYAYVRHAQGGRSGQLMLSFFFFVCSLLSKATFVTLPFVFLLFDVWPLRRLMGQSDVGPASSRHPRIGRLILEKVPFLIGGAAFSVVAFLSQSSGGALRSLTVLPLWARVANAITVYGLYLRQAVIPIDLAPIYPHPGAGVSLAGGAASFVFLCLVTTVAITERRRRPFLLIGWLWYLGTLLPMIGLVQVGVHRMADRYTYFPLLGLYMAVAWLAPSLAPVLVPIASLRKWVIPAIAAGIVGVYASLAFVQAGYWCDSLTLFQHALAATEDNPRTRLALGSALLERGRYQESIAQLRQAVQMDPADAQIHFVLACGLQQAECWDQAAAEHRASLAIDEQNAPAHNDLGLILFKQRRYAEAKRELMRATELDENDLPAWVNLALLSGEVREFGDSIAYSRRALQLDPSLVVCRRLMETAFRAQGRLVEAQQLSDGFRD